MNNFKRVNFFSPLVLLVFFVGILTTFFLYTIVQKEIEHVHTNEIKHLLKRNNASIQRELDIDFLVLQSLKSFFDSSQNVDRTEFSQFTQDFLGAEKSVQALSWIPRVPNKLRAEYEKQAEHDLKQNFGIKNKSDTGKMVLSEAKNEYFPVYYIEPLVGNSKALGFDLASNDTRLMTLKEAQKTRKVAITPRITLVQEKGKQFGFLAIIPVWEKENKELLKGYVSGVFRVEDMIRKAFEYVKDDRDMLDMWLVDATNKNKPELLFTNTNEKENIITTTFIELNNHGRNWILYAKPSQKFIEENKSFLSMSVLFIGLFITVLLLYIVILKVKKENDLKELISEKTDKLIQSNNKYQTLLEMFDKKVIASRTDKKGIITYATKAFTEISGYSKEELIGENHRIVRHPDMPKEIYVQLWNTITSGEIFTGEIKNRKKDGNFYWVNVTIFPEYDDNKNIVGYFAIREDITAKKEVENFNITLEDEVKKAVEDNQQKDRLLLEQSKLAAMGEMVGAIAHQWRQPLNALAMRIQFIEDDFEDEMINKEYVKEYSIEGMKLVNFMSKTIDDFRNFFTIDKVKSEFSIREKIDETVNMLSGQLANHKIKVEINENNFIVMGYSSEFQQVILNILNNAKDAFIEKEIENGKIKIDIGTQENIGFIKIEDNAGGIPLDVIKRIFEPYYTTKEQGKGTGLGLYMSKMIIEDNMKGNINVANVENGALFTIELEVLNG